MRSCIYCRAELMGKVPHEHVIPQGYGVFSPDLTLNCVCSTCNGYFGRALEWPMRNSSYEGVMRFHNGLGAGQVGNIGTRGLELIIAEAPEWQGARIILKADQNGNAYTDLIPQIGARKTSADPFVWYLEKDICAGFDHLYPKGSEFRIIGNSAADQDRLHKRLLSVVPTFEMKGTMNPPFGPNGKVLIHFENEFDSIIRRFLAKVAINYLAFTIGEDFASDQQFDRVRSFVRYGVEPLDGIVYVSRKPILANEVVLQKRITDGHILTVELNSVRHTSEVRLSLFNGIRYRVVLALQTSGVWFTKGHHFDLESRKVSELGKAVEIFLTH